jgi:hypothetical protein
MKMRHGNGRPDRQNVTQVVSKDYVCAKTRREHQRNLTTMSWLNTYCIHSINDDGDDDKQGRLCRDKNGTQINRLKNKYVNKKEGGR